jgi:hypothetical protein
MIMKTTSRSVALLATLVLTAIPFVGVGCQKPFVLETRQGGPLIYPDGLYGKPTVLAFLSANDRRCDLALKPLAAYHHRGDSPVKVVAVLVYDRYDFVKQIQTLDQAVFTVLLDPEKKLAKKYSIKKYPTYVYLDTRVDELARTYEIGGVRPWMDDKIWHERGYRLPEGALRKTEYRELEQGYDPYKAAK